MFNGTHAGDSPENLWDYLSSDHYDGVSMIVSKAFEEMNAGRPAANVTTDDLIALSANENNAPYNGYAGSRIIGMDPPAIKDLCYGIGLTTVDKESSSETDVKDDAFFYGFRNAEEYDEFCNQNIWGDEDPSASDVYIPQEHRSTLWPSYSMRNTTFGYEDVWT